VNINDETLRVTWDDGEGTHPLVHLIEHGLTFEEGADGEPALDLMMEEPPLRRIRSAQAESATSSSGGSTSSSDGEADDSDRPPLETAHTKAGVSWKHEPEGIRTDNRTRSLDEDPSFACGNANITTLIGLFLYLMCPAFGAGAVEHTNAMYPDPCDHTSLPELYIFYGYMAYIAATAGSFALNDLWREQEMADSFRVAAGKRPMYQSNCVICGGDTSWFCALCGEGCALHPEKTRFGKEYDCLAKHRECPSYRKWARRQRTTSGVSD